MMGRTHALGGAVALAAYAHVTGEVATIPAWGYLVAAGSALVPDADNGRGTILNRPHLYPLKLMSLPLWGPGNPRHRGRTHSLLAAGAWVALVWFWFLLANLGLDALDAGFQLPFTGIVAAAGLGYLSHLLLDMFNIEPLQLLWPLPLDVGFPPWRARGFLPGRFHAGAWFWEGTMIWFPLLAFAGWFAVQYGATVVAATNADKTIWQALTFIVRAFVDLITGAVRS
jgi:membrane-bound metal-dependent hydrolase YbcI (DUF457 family)